MSELVASVAIQAVDRITAPVRKIRQQMSSLGSSVASSARKSTALSNAQRRLSESISRTTRRLREQQGSLGGQIAGVVGLAASLAMPVRAAIKFESVMADIRKVLDFDTPQQFKEMRNDLLEMSKRIPKSVEELGQIAAAAGQAGIAKKDILKLTEQAAEMGVAFDISGEQAGSAMTGLMSIFHKSVEGAVLIGDSFNHLSNSMDVHADELLEIANRTGGLGAGVGMTAQQVGAFGATLKALKTPTEVAGTAMNALFNRFGNLGSQTPKFRKAMESIGISVDGFQKSMKKDAGSALLGFFKRVHKAGDKGKQALFEMFGMEYTPQLAKFANNTQMLSNALGLVGDSTKYAGSMHEEYILRCQTTEVQLQKLRNRTEVLGITLGSALLPAVNAVAGKLGWAADKVAKLAERFPVATKVVLGLAAALVGAKVATIALNLAMKTNPWVAGISAAAAAAMMIYDNWGKIWDWMCGMADKVAKVFSNIGSSIAGAFKGLLPSSWFGDEGATGGGKTSSASPSIKSLKAGGSTTVHAPVNNNITVHATPGMDESALARHIGEELDKRQRKAGAQTRAALHDIG